MHSGLGRRWLTRENGRSMIIGRKKGRSMIIGWKKGRDMMGRNHCR